MSVWFGVKFTPGIIIIIKIELLFYNEFIKLILICHNCLLLSNKLAFFSTSDYGIK